MLYYVLDSKVWLKDVCLMKLFCANSVAQYKESSHRVGCWGGNHTKGSFSLISIFTLECLDVTQGALDLATNEMN